MIKKKKKLHSKFLTKGEMGATLIPPPPPELGYKIF